MLSRKVNKKELIARVQHYMGPGATRSTASAALEAVLASIVALSSRERLQITRFGSFEWQDRPARRAYSIPGARHTTLPPTRRLTFHPAKNFPHRPV